MMPGAVDTTAQDLFALVGLAAALFLVWLVFDGDVQVWRRTLDLRRIVSKVQVAVAEDIARTRKWNKGRRRRR